MPDLQLALILAELAKQEGSYDKLSRAIKNCDERGPAGRTLQGVCEDNNVGNAAAKKSSLTKAHLEAIDRYLREKGHPGLDTVRIFEPDRLLRSLVEHDQTILFLPPRVPKEEPHREYVSSWDLQAAQTIAGAIGGFRAGIQIAFETLPPIPPETRPESIDWRTLLTDKSGAICAIGAPLASGLSSYMLGQMLEVENPFVPPRRAEPQPLPFYFAWYPSDGASDVPPSAFALGASDLTDNAELQEAIGKRQAQAFRIGRKVLPVWLDRDPHAEYGVIAAQRRPFGAVWVVVAGLSGPGTYACAQKLGDVNLALPARAEGQPSRVVFAVVKCEVSQDRGKSFGDNRKVESAAFVEEPTVWPPRA